MRCGTQSPREHGYYTEEDDTGGHYEHDVASVVVEGVRWGVVGGGGVGGRAEGGGGGSGAGEVICGGGVL